MHTHLKFFTISHTQILHNSHLNNELPLACQLHHPNHVPLIGYCLDDQQMILVYESLVQSRSIHMLIQARQTFGYGWINQHSVVKTCRLTFLQKSFFVSLSFSFWGPNYSARESLNIVSMINRRSQSTNLQSSLDQFTC